MKADIVKATMTARENKKIILGDIIPNNLDFIF